MKVTAVRPVLVDRYLFVEVDTDEGIKGTGESGTWAFQRAAAEMVRYFGEYLIGRDPLQIEHHWQYLYRAFHFRGSVIMGALSAIDIALWDIAGQYHGVPVHNLLGGPTRTKARVYEHVFGASREELVRGCAEAKAAGFDAVGHLTPFVDSPRSEPFETTFVGQLAWAVESVGQYRQAVGSSVDLCIEIHRQLSAAQAIALGRELEQYRPMFYEDPVPPDNFDEMALVADKVAIPIATGERLTTVQEFEMLLRRGAVQYVRPDVCMCGGITGARKVAALAEAHHVGVVPHNPLSPVSTVACLHLAAAIANFAIQEYPLGEDEAPKIEIVSPVPKREGAYLLVPDAPGLGIALVYDAAQKHPFQDRKLETRLHADGSVVDQ
jgi:galactonate dehydratase